MSNAPINYGPSDSPDNGPVASLAESQLGYDRAGVGGRVYIGGGHGPEDVNNIAGALAQQGASFQNAGAPNTFTPGMQQWAGYGQQDQQQQLSALANLQAQAQGTGNYGQGAVQQGLVSANANQQALAASGGAGARGALAQRASQAQQAQNQAQAGNTARILQAQGQLAGAGQYQQGLNEYQKGISQQQQLDQQAIEQQASVNQQQQNLQDWAQEQYTGQAQQIEASQLANDTNAYNSGLNAISQQNVAQANASAQQNQAIEGGAMSAMGAMLAMFSDIRKKDDIQPQGKTMNGRPMQPPMMPMRHAVSEGAKGNPAAMTGGMAGQRFGQPGGMAPMGARPPLGQVMARPGMGPSPAYMGELRQGMNPQAYHGGGRQMPMGQVPQQMPPQQFSRKNNIVMQPGAPGGAQGLNPALAGMAPQMGGGYGGMMGGGAPPPQMGMAGAAGMGALMSDERAKIVSRDLMSDNGLSTGRMLLEGQGDPNHKYRPIDDNVGIRHEYAPPTSITSDERAKDGMYRGPMHEATEADHFLAHLHPYTYKYKDPSYEPTNEPTGGHYLGVMAQDVEQTPGIGRQIVKDTPRGKMLEGGALMSAMAGGLGRLHERVSALEGSRGRVQ